MNAPGFATEVKKGVRFAEVMTNPFECKAYHYKR